MNLRTRIALILAVLLTALGAFSALAPAAHAERKVLITCPVDKTAVQADPIKGYGISPFGHGHTSIGSTAFSSTMTFAQMSSSPTTCLLKSDHTSGWFPTPLKPDGTPATILSVKYYLQVKDAGADVNVDPTDLKFVTGRPGNTGQYGDGIFGCLDQNNQYITNTHTIPTAAQCAAPNAKLIQWTQFSEPCWDGVNKGPGLGENGGPADATSHMRKYVTGNTCPAGFFQIPQISLTVLIGLDAAGGRLSSDAPPPAYPGSSAHFDWVYNFVNNSAGQPALPLLISQCLNSAQAKAAPVGKQSCREIDPVGAPSYIRFEQAPYTYITD